MSCLRLGFLGAICAVALSASNSRAQSHITRDLLPTRTSLERVGLERQWFTSVPFAGLNERLLGIDLEGGVLFAQTNSASLYAIDPESGKIHWRQRLALESEINDTYVRTAVQPAVNSTSVFAASSNILFCFERSSGNLIWSIPLTAGKPGGSSNPLEAMATISSPIAADEERVMVGQASGRVLCYKLNDPKTGRQLKKPLFSWAWQTNGEVTSRPSWPNAFSRLAAPTAKSMSLRPRKPTS